MNTLKYIDGASLVVQWLGLFASNARGMSSIPVQGTKIPHAMWCGQNFFKLKYINMSVTINWKILKEMGIPDHLICLLRNLYADQEATVRTGHGTTDWFHIGKGVRQGCILSPCLFNLYAEYIIQNAGLDDSQTGIKIAGRCQQPQICR